MNQQELNKILDQHKLWLESKGRQGKRINYAGVNLEGANLQHTNLRKSILSASNLANADLTGADLSDVDLSGTYLVGARFDFNFRKVEWFYHATVSKDQLCWLILHPEFGKFKKSLTIV